MHCIWILPVGHIDCVCDYMLIHKENNHEDHGNKIDDDDHYVDDNSMRRMRMVVVVMVMILIAFITITIIIVIIIITINLVIIITNTITIFIGVLAINTTIF